MNMLLTIVFVGILGTYAISVDKGIINSGAMRSRRYVHILKGRPCPDGGTCCSNPYIDSDAGNQTFYLKCGDIADVFPPCRRVHRRHTGFPACCPILDCPRYFTYLDAYVFTISVLKSYGKAYFQYGRRGKLVELTEPLKPRIL